MRLLGTVLDKEPRGKATSSAVTITITLFELHFFCL